MDAHGVNSEWRAAEREYADPVVGDGTLSELFEESADRNTETTAQRYKGGVYDRSLTPDVIPAAPTGEYRSLSYGSMQDVVRRLAAGFRSLGVTADDRVGVFADTRMEWAMSDFGLLAAGAVVTTVYTDSSERQVRYLLSDPGATGVVVENAELLERVLAVEDDLDLDFVVVMDAHESDREDVYSLADVYRLGEDEFDAATYREWLDERDPEDAASIIYTSGTTGRPKGVRLTHRNFRSNVNQVYKRLGPRPDKGPDTPVISTGTVSIAFLPLAHVFERLAGHFLMFGAGATVGYAESSDTLADDLGLVRPTTGASVPRVYERIFDNMREQAGSSPVKERIFHWAVDVAREWAVTDDPGLSLRAKHALADRLVYSKLLERLGGNVEFMVSGGGSLSAELCRTFAGMGLTVVEGYGLTETAPVISVNPVEDIRPGTLGLPVVDMEVRIDEHVVEQRDFDSAAGAVGELQVRGPNVADGYWNDESATEHAFTDDGWFRTGDIVSQTDDGYLLYHDRLKEVIVLSTGKNVAPQPIEDAFSTSDRVDQVMVVGDERKFVGALIVPNFDQLHRWARKEGIDLPDDEAAVCEDERVRAWIGEAVGEVNADLERVERIKEFALISREWTTENDLLTPSMKKKRRNIREAFDEHLARIYDEQAATAD